MVMNNEMEIHWKQSSWYIGCFRLSTNGIYQLEGNKPASGTFRGGVHCCSQNEPLIRKMKCTYLKQMYCNYFNYNLPISIKYSYHLQRRHYIGKHISWECYIYDAVSICLLFIVILYWTSNFITLSGTLRYLFISTWV